jgi:hypothetical protein
MADAVTADLLSGAHFVIKATAVSLGDTRVTDIPVDDHTVVFKIDQVLHAPAALARSAGLEITVQLAAGSPVPAVGEQLTLFTTPVAYGEGIAVAEVGRVAPGSVLESSTIEPDSPARRSRPRHTLSAVQQRREEQRRAHAMEADVIVIGRVVRLEKAGDPVHREHDPDWWLATVTVAHRVKGPVTDTVRFVFPNSRDVRWINAPKPAPGDSSLWLLHKATGDVAGLADYSLLHTDDVQGPDELEGLDLRGGRE